MKFKRIKTKLDLIQLASGQERLIIDIDGIQGIYTPLEYCDMLLEKGLTPAEAIDICHEVENAFNVSPFNEDNPSIQDIADTFELKIDESTDDMTGYPKHVRKVLTKFKNYEDAKAIAEYFNYTLIELYANYGWNLWYANSRSHVFSAFDMQEFYENKEYKCFTYKSQLIDEIKEVAAFFIENIEDADTLDNVVRLFDNASILIKKIKECNPKMFVVSTYDFKYIDTFNMEEMEYNDDDRSRKYAIGAIKY